MLTAIICGLIGVAIGYGCRGWLHKEIGEVGDKVKADAKKVI